MFDKAAYWKRRQASIEMLVPDTDKNPGKDGKHPLKKTMVAMPQRGQDTLPVIFHPKGEQVTYTNRKGETASYPNAQGGQMMRTKTGWVYVNRKDQRAKSPRRFGSKPNYDYQSGKNGFKHTIKPTAVPDTARPAKTGHTMNRRLHLHARWLRKLAAQNKLMEV